MMLLEDYPGSKPLWSQLYDILLERIKNQVYRLDETLPTDKELMEEFQVSRITVRNAMSKLISEGYIVRHRGVGSKVVKNEEDSISTHLKLSYKGIYEDNKEKDKIIRKIEKVKPTNEIAVFFDIHKSKKVLYLMREVRKNNEIIAIHETYLNPITKLAKISDLTGSLYDKLRKLDFEINCIQEKVSSSIITTEQQIIFGLDDIQAVMQRERRGYSNGIPIEFTRSTYLGEKYKLSIELGEN